MCNCLMCLDCSSCYTFPISGLSGKFNVTKCHRVYCKIYCDNVFQLNNKTRCAWSFVFAAKCKWCCLRKDYCLTRSFWDLKGFCRPGLPRTSFMEPYYVLFCFGFVFVLWQFKQVSIYYRCLGESCHAETSNSEMFCGLRNLNNFRMSLSFKISAEFTGKCNLRMLLVEIISNGQRPCFTHEWPEKYWPTKAP